MCMCAYGHPGAAICDFQHLWFAFWSRVLCADLINIIVGFATLNLCLVTLIQSNDASKFVEKA